jgi:hypothetical protein
MSITRHTTSCCIVYVSIRYEMALPRFPITPSAGELGLTLAFSRVSNDA